MAFRTPRPVEALRIRLPAQPVPVPPPCTARGSAAPLPPSHRGVHHTLTVEDDTESCVTRPETPARGPSNPSSRRGAQDQATRTAGTRPPSLHGTRLSSVLATQPPWLTSRVDRGRRRRELSHRARDALASGPTHDIRLRILDPPYVPRTAQVGFPPLLTPSHPPPAPPSWVVQEGIGGGKNERNKGETLAHFPISHMRPQGRTS